MRTAARILHRQIRKSCAIVRPKPGERRDRAGSPGARIRRRRSEYGRPNVDLKTGHWAGAQRLLGHRRANRAAKKKKKNDGSPAIADDGIYGDDAIDGQSVMSLSRTSPLFYGVLFALRAWRLTVHGGVARTA